MHARSESVSNGKIVERMQALAAPDSFREKAASRCGRKPPLATGRSGGVQGGIVDAASVTF